MDEFCKADDQAVIYSKVLNHVDSESEIADWGQTEKNLLAKHGRGRVVTYLCELQSDLIILDEAQRIRRRQLGPLFDAVSLIGIRCIPVWHTKRRPSKS
jgi:hypothetical protein